MNPKKELLWSLWVERCSGEQKLRDALRHCAWPNCVGFERKETLKPKASKPEINPDQYTSSIA